MKKTLLSVAAFAAIVMTGFADPTPWFNGGITNAVSGGSWTNPLPTGVTSNEYHFALEDVTSFAFTASQGQSASASQNLNFTTSVKFQYAYDELPEIASGDKAGVIAYTVSDTTNYWVIGKVDSTNGWKNTGITAQLDGVDVVIAMTNGTDGVHAVYSFGASSKYDTLLANSAAVTVVDYSGCGSINSLIGQLIAMGIIVPGYPQPIPQGQQLTAWLAANNMTESDLQVTTPQANGNTAYENCVLGIKNDAKLVANAADTSASKITFGLTSVQMPGVNVEYNLKTNATVLATGSTPSFERDIHDGVFQIVAKIQKNEGYSEIGSAKVGAMKINSTKGTEYIAVPWTAFGGAAGIAPTNLVKATGLTANDTLEVYDAANGDWEGYRWTGTVWEPTTGEKHVTTLTRGMAVKLTRANGSADTYLVGGAVDNAASTTLQNAKWNLVANPGFGAYTIGTNLGTDTKDQVMVAGDTVFSQYTYRSADGWRKIVPEVKDGIQTNTRKEQDLTVPQGVGFFFVNKSGKSAINW